jgi:hypothetical protein
MKAIIFGLIILTCKVIGQSDTQTPTIPLNKTIQIKIISIDSLTFGRYILYSFKYKNNKASFWAAREDKVFKKGLTSVELCRIIQMRDIKDGEKTNFRGCSFYNGLTILANDTILKQFNFNEYSSSPTLRLCSTDK